MNQLMAQEFLKKDLEQRQNKNSSFSLRAYARWLNISPSHLSQIISGKRNLTRKKAFGIIEKLNLSPLEREAFLKSLDGELSQSHSDHFGGATLIREDEFQLIADWHHFAILSLAEVDNKADPRWVASRLGIGVQQAREACDRLIRLGLMQKQEKRYIATNRSVTTSNDISSGAIKKHHKQNLALASEKLDLVPVELREFSSMTMAIDPSKIEEAKIAIRDFKKKIGLLLESGEKKEVYTISIQLFPNTKSTEV